MTMKTCVIRLWAPTILLGVMALSAFGGSLEGQAAPPAQAAQAAPRTVPTPAQKVQLDQAAKLAADGKYAAAMTIYRRVLGTHPPPGDLALVMMDDVPAPVLVSISSAMVPEPGPLGSRLIPLKGPPAMLAKVMGADRM